VIDAFARLITGWRTAASHSTELAVCWVADKTGKVRLGEGKLL
jgi:hypothetical protein